MRLEVHVNIGGDVLAQDDTGSNELARIILDVTGEVLAGHLVGAGDFAPLKDSNGVAVGHAVLIPDWKSGDSVWVTTLEGPLLEGEIFWVERAKQPGYVRVGTKFVRSQEPLTSVIVDAWGNDQRGRPVLGRR